MPHLQVLLAAGNTVMTVDVDSAEQTASGVGSIQKLSIAPNGQFVAAYTADGRLKVWGSDFTKALSEFATQSEKLPEQLEWCGTDSVVMCWEVRLSLYTLFWLVNGQARQCQKGPIKLAAPIQKSKGLS